jgi:hypothetical protein
MISRDEFFQTFLSGTTGRMELRRMKWRAQKNRYDMLERLFSRDLTEMETFSRNGGGDIFHGVNLRDDSGTAKKRNISEIVAAAIDVDFKKTPKENVDEILATIEPTFLIGSGGGYHGYFMLNHPVPANDENVNLIESINKGLARHFGGDYTHDITRILRTPGRKNSKYADGRMCEVIRAGGWRYSLEDLRPFAQPTENGACEIHIDGCKNELPGRFQELLQGNKTVQKIWRGEEVNLRDKSRNGYDMKMANVLVGLGFGVDEIAAVLLQMPSGKARERGHSYLETTIAKAWKCRAEKEEITGEEDESKEKILFEVMKNITSEDVDYLWAKRIARGKLTLFSGDPEVGKSFVSLKIAASLSQGEALPFDGEPETPLRSLIISAEDAPSDTIKPRLERLGADMSMIAVPHREAEVSLKTDFLEQLLDQWPAAYCVIDPIIAFAGGKNTNRASDVRSLLGPLVNLAEERNLAVVMLLHLNKNVGVSALYRGQGSIDFSGVCRSVFTFAVNNGRRFMAHTKNSLSTKQKTLEYFIDETGRFSWGDECDETADEILGDPKQRASEQLEAAKAFLIETLCKDWILSTKVEELAALKGISRRTLWRAKADIGVKAKRVQAQWYWVLA